MTELHQQIKDSKLRLIKRWIVDPQTNRMPKDISFGEWHATLDELQDTIDKCREMHPSISED